MREEELEEGKMIKIDGMKKILKEEIMLNTTTDYAQEETWSHNHT